MELQPLTAISPIDGRYRTQTAHLDSYFSEFALIKQRVVVENFSLNDAQKIKNIEGITNHDVKAVEYFLKEELEKAGSGNIIKEWIHFGLTSQDINNTAIPMLWKAVIENEYLPAIESVRNNLKEFAKIWKDIAMLAHTHGQPASPTTLGKEIMVYAERIQNQLEQFAHIPFTAKFGGATGNFNAHVVAYPKTGWIKFADQFVEKKLGLKRQQFTTQIEHYDMLAAHFDNIKRINTILIDLCRDVWQYISMNYFKQKINKNEVGSSAMPHKVNPIDFENAEGNLGIANALLEHFSAKLPISRLQRDLTDSTVIRNIGVPVAHTIISMRSLQKGLGKLILNEEKIKDDLENNWAVVAEAIQTILRRENYPEPYEALKVLTRNNSVLNKQSIHSFIDSLKVSSAIKKELKNITPHNYIGYCPF
jgi:adenylosuccinate lyase